MKLIRRISFFIYSAALIVATLFLLRPTIEKFQKNNNSWDFEAKEDAISVKVGKQLYFTSPGGGPSIAARSIAVSLPLSDTNSGCETIYGAVSAYISSGKIISRYLIKFEYENGQASCISTELSFRALDFPSSIHLSLVDVESTEKELIETPRSKSIVLGYDSTLNSFSLKPSFEEGKTEARRTRKNQTLSWTPAVAETELYSAPYQDIKEVILREIKNTTERCISSKECLSIRGAIAHINDNDILQAFAKAQKSGIKVELITNPDEDFLSTANDRWQELIPPWVWLRGNPLYKDLRAKLPMHARFLIIGNNTVISTNSNYSFEKFPNSKEINLVYRGEKATQVFEEIFSIIRSGFFYPLKIDRNQQVSILLNADRPRGYSRYPLKPYLQITTEDGTASSAYGILFDLIKTSARQLSLAMSPLSNSCAFYKEKNCFKDILRDLQSSSSLNLILNGFFFLNSEALSWSEEDRKDVYWDEVPINSEKSYFTKTQQFLKKFDLGSQGISVNIGIDQFWSAHHERAGVINRDTVLLGSANFAQPSTLNTIEIIKNENFACRILDDFEQSKEPYYVVTRNKESKNYRTNGDCEFMFERDILNGQHIIPFKVSKQDIEKEFAARYGNNSVPVALVLPKSIDSVYKSYDKLKALRFETKEIESNNETFSHFLCVTDKKGSKRVIKISNKAC